MELIIRIKKKRKHLFNDPWVWKLAWQDARHNLGRLFLFISSIIIGIAALVAINSFNSNLQDDIDVQAKDLLGADLVVNSNKAFDSVAMDMFDTLDFEQGMDVRFASMVLFVNNNGGTRLIQVVATQGDFPFYGKVETLPENALEIVKSSKSAILDESLAIQFEVSSGDSLKLGRTTFLVAGIVKSMPGSNAVSASFTPSVYIDIDYLDDTELIQFGSRYSYKRYFKTENLKEADELLAQIKPHLRKGGYRWDTVEEEKEDLGEAFANLYRFFNLLGFVALILGCIGVASSVHIYVQEKKNTVALLRCIGASSWQAFNVFLIQAISLGILGSALGVILGVAIQFGAPAALKTFIPLEMHVSIVWPAVFQGLVLGIMVAVLFSLLPLAGVRNIPPLIVLRSYIDKLAGWSKMRVAIILGVVLFPWLFAIYQTQSLQLGSIFLAGLLGSFLCLLIVARILIWLTQKFFPSSWSFVWRQGLANLFRPNNQTTVLVVVIGLGAFLVSTLNLVQNSLLHQVEFMGSDDRANTVLFDIQTYQKEGVAKLVAEHDLPVQQLVPIVTTRISRINDKTIKQIQADSSSQIPNWSMTREYRVTYRDSLISSEELVEGKLLPKVENPGDSIFVSISESMAETLEVGVGDSVTFDVQGVPILTYIGSIRAVDWQRIQTNFIFVFPVGVLEAAPQFYVLMTRAESNVQSSLFQQALVRNFPNVSAIDLTLILKTIDDFMSKVAFVIQFMAMFSIITGLIVLSGAVSNSKYLRLKENVLLRTLGAVKKQVVKMTLIEYGYLGMFAGLTGILLSLLGGWGLSVTFFEVAFVPDFGVLGFIWFIVVALTMTVGWINTRGVLNNSPLEVLRRED